MDKKIINIKLNNIKKNLKYLEETHKRFKKEKDEFELILLKSSISKFIEEIVENAIKINTIILKENKIYIETYFESFSALKKVFNTDEDFINQIAKTASFRNNIVHNYDSEKTQINLEKNIEPIIYLYSKYIELIENNYYYK